MQCIQRRLAAMIGIDQASISLMIRAAAYCDVGSCRHVDYSGFLLRIYFSMPECPSRRIACNPNLILLQAMPVLDRRPVGANVFFRVTCCLQPKPSDLRNLLAGMTAGCFMWFQKITSHRRPSGTCALSKRLMKGRSSGSSVRIHTRMLHRQARHQSDRYLDGRIPVIWVKTG